MKILINLGTNVLEDAGKKALADQCAMYVRLSNADEDESAVSFTEKADLRGVHADLGTVTIVAEHPHARPINEQHAARVLNCLASSSREFLPKTPVKVFILHDGRVTHEK